MHISLKKGTDLRRGAAIAFSAFAFAILAGFCSNIFEARAATGVPYILGFQGRLLNSSGNLLGGTGTPYCFEFSIYDSVSGGTKLWPSGTPSQMTATVANGVFNIGVGDTSAGGDTLTYDFQSNNTIYLDVQVATKTGAVCGTFEELSPRQQILASGYAINSATLGGFVAAQQASGNQIPVLTSGNLTLAGTNPQINATGTNTLTLQGGAGTGAIQFFSANNYINTSTFRMAGTVSANALQMAVAPSQSTFSSLMSLGQSPIQAGAASGTFIGINTAGAYNGDYLEFENNSSTVLNVASSGQMTIGTSTNIANSLFSIATSSNIFTVLNNGNVGIGTTTPGYGLTVAGTSFYVGTSSFMGNMGIGTSTLVSNALLTIGTSSNIFTISANGNIGIGTSTPAAKLQVAGAAALGVPTSTEGQLLFYDSTNGNITTIQPSTSTAKSVTFTLPNSTGTPGQSLITDGTGKLSWGSTGFTVISSSTAPKALAVTMASDTLATIHPSNGSSSIWVTADIMASTTAAGTSTVNLAVFKAANCTTQVGTTVSSTLRQSITSMALNVVDAPGTTTAQTYYLCADYVTNTVSLTYGELTLQEIRAGSDIAESYNAATDTPLTEGNIVSLDPTITDGVQPSQSAYDSTLVGVVSTQPGAVLGNATPQGSQVLVALAGRVPVQVTNANGNISIGDELTSSDIPGVAMRATEPGRVVGVAMENFAPDPSAGTTTGSILVFVNPGWSPGISTSAANTTTSVSSFSTSVDDALQHFFGIVADASNAVQAFVRASMVAVENLFVKTETILPGGSIVVPSGRDQISGSATLAPLYQNVFIANQQVTSSSKIFVTPTTLITVPLVVISKQDGVGFTVGVSDPQANGISFDWVIVQSYSAGGDGTSEIQGGAPASSGGGGVTNDTSADNTSAASSSDVAPDDATSNASSSAGTSTDTAASSTDDVSAPTSSDQSNNVSSSDETTTSALSDPTVASTSATDSTAAPASVGDGSSADAAATPVSAPTDSSPPAPTPDPSADTTTAQ